MSELRRRWMGVLAKADSSELESMCATLGRLPEYRWLRRPETGLVMVCGRIGGTGAKFNVGEVPVTRCALRIEGGATGFAYVRGRNHRHAELAAMVDALMQDPGRRAGVEATVVTPLERGQQSSRELAQRKAAATRVEFYTVAREGTA